MATATFLAGMSDICVSKGPAQYTCLGLGSCVGVAAYDPSSGVSGMAHIMLPNSFPDKLVERPGKFADTAFEAMLAQMIALGANADRIQVALCGGAQVFRFGQELSSMLQIGERLTVAAREQIQRLGIRLVGEDLGGNLGRTVTFTSESGEVRVRTVSQGEKLLCNLKGGH